MINVCLHDYGIEKSGICKVTDEVYVCGVYDHSLMNSVRYKYHPYLVAS